MIQLEKNNFKKEFQVKVKKRYYFILFVILVVGLLVSGYIEGERIDITHYQFNVSDKKLDQEIKIAQLTDVHSLSDAKRKDEIYQKLSSEKPTHIVLTGDIITAIDDVENTYTFLERLKQLAPLFYVSGNHEYDDDTYDVKTKHLEAIGVTVLNDAKVDLTSQVRLIGVEDVSKVFTYKQSDRAREIMENKIVDVGGRMVDKDKYNILLYHRPHYIEAFQKGGYNLVLTGHVHGGQWQDPTHSLAAIGPDQGIFPKYFKGKHTFDQMTMINSRGLDYTSTLPRFYNAREIVIVTLK